MTCILSGESRLLSACECGRELEKEISRETRGDLKTVGRTGKWGTCDLKAGRILSARQRRAGDIEEEGGKRNKGTKSKGTRVR